MLVKCHNKHYEISEKAIPHVHFFPSQSNLEFHQNRMPKVVLGAAKPHWLRATWWETVKPARWTSAIRQVSAWLSQRQTLRQVWEQTIHICRRWSPKTPVGERWSETWKERQPKKVVISSPSPLWAPAASSCRGYWGHLQNVHLRVIPWARWGKYLPVIPTGHGSRAAAGREGLSPASACYLVGKAGRSGHCYTRPAGGLTPALWVEAWPGEWGLSLADQLS